MAIESTEKNENTIKMPAPTSWPFVLSLGLALLFGGLVTGAAISILGAVLAVAGVYGWFREVLPSEAHEAVPALEEAAAASTLRTRVARIDISPEMSRAFLPIETYPVSAGVKGGLAGSVAMAFFAMLFGVVSGHGIWYPINLLAAGFFPASMLQSTAQMEKFNLEIFLIAVAIHLLTSLLVGLLYGAMLPMLPRRPVLLGGFIGPILWSALIYSILDIVNPVLSSRIDWFWFVLSQVGFGMVAGIVVSRQQRVRTSQPMPLAVRLGIEASGMAGEKGEGREEER
jgi:hypothetical protein